MILGRVCSSCSWFFASSRCNTSRTYSAPVSKTSRENALRFGTSENVKIEIMTAPATPHDAM